MELPLPIFSGMPESFPKFLTLFEAKLAIQSSSKCYDFNIIENPTAAQTKAFNDYLNAFKINSLKASLGDHLEDVVSTVPAKEMEEFEDFKKALKNHFLPKRNIIHSICKFSNARQGDGETLQNFLSRVQRLRAEADLSNLTSLEILDMWETSIIVLGLKNTSLSTKIQLMDKISLNDARKLIITSEGHKESNY